MSENKSNFWTTLPGIITAIAAMITSIGGLIAVIPSIDGSNSNSNRNEFVVKANNVSPTVFRLKEKNKSQVKVNFNTTGTWSVGTNPEFPDVDANGYERDIEPRYRYEWKCPREKLGALIYKINENGLCKVAGQHVELTLDEEDIVYFYINDRPDSHNDNHGYMTVDWKLSK